jgi:hypothetical protein
MPLFFGTPTPGDLSARDFDGGERTDPVRYTIFNVYRNAVLGLLSLAQESHDCRTLSGVDDVYGQGAPCLSTVQTLVADFAAGEEGLEDRPRSDGLRSDQNTGLMAQTTLA